MQFLIFVTAAVVAGSLFQLGALSVWVAVLSLTLKAMLAIALFAALYFVWRRYRGPVTYPLPKPEDRHA